MGDKEGQLKVLIIYHAGLADDARRIFSEYAKQGVDVTVIVPSKIHYFTGWRTFNDAENEKAYRFIPVDFKAGFNFFQLFSAIKKAKPDIIHVLDEYVSVYLFQTILCRNILYGFRKKRVPVLAMAMQNLSLTSLPIFVFDSFLAFLKRLMYQAFLPIIFLYHKYNLDGIIGGNQEALQNVRNVNAKIPTKFIFWGVDTSIFSKGDKVAARNTIGIPQNVPLIGYFGKIIEQKGLETLIYALSRLPEHHLLLVGNGEYEEKLSALIKSLGVSQRVHKFNAVKLAQLPEYYHALDVFVLPTKTTPDCKEQYGRVLVEAMACDIAVVGSTCGAIPEVLKGYPKHLIFQEKNVDDLVDKIQEVKNLVTPAEFNLGVFLHKFSVKNFVTENINFYREILRR